MTLRVDPAPRGGRAQLAAYLADEAHGRAKPPDIRVPRPLSLWRVEADDAQASIAIHFGWRFIVLGNKVPMWVDFQRVGKQLRMSSSIKGDDVSYLLDVATQLENSMVAQPASDPIVRILYLGHRKPWGFWLHSENDDYFASSRGDFWVCPISEAIADFEPQRLNGPLPEPKPLTDLPSKLGG